jgi:aromatic ring-opening dioxygenase catalytic subunit (LigB family)
MSRMPTFFLSHGGGPWPYLHGDIRAKFALLESSLRMLPEQVGADPAAILVISAHWEDEDFAVMSSPAPRTIYDFSGSGCDLTRIRYPAPGSPDLARRTHALIRGAGLRSRLDPVRGFDHGVYSLLAVAYPDASIPVVQVAISSDYDPHEHLQLGRALAPLREEGVLIIGSGMSHHNLDSREDSVRFDRWLEETLVGSEARQRSVRLSAWNRAPGAREAHPREHHLVPLFAAVGAAEDESAEIVYREENFQGKVTLSSYRFG